METKKTEVIGAITSAKDSAITYLENIKNTQVSEIEEVGKRLDDFNTDMVGLVSVHTHETKRKSDDGYNDVHNKISQYLIDSAYDSMDIHREIRERELKSIINKDKSVNNINMPNVSRINKGSIKVPYRPLLWLKGGNIIDRYGLEPFDYHPDMFDSDGTFNYKTCKGQIMEDGFWCGLGTSNILPPGNTSTGGNISMGLKNKSLFVYSDLKIDKWGGVIAHHIPISDLSNTRWSCSGNENNDSYIYLEMQNVIDNYEPSMCPIHTNKDFSVNNTNYTPSSNTQYRRLLFNINNPENEDISRRNDITCRIQIERDKPISTPWVFNSRSETFIKYRLTEGMSSTAEAITYLVFNEPKIIKNPDTNDVWNNYNIITMRDSVTSFVRNISCIRGASFQNYQFKKYNNIAIIHNNILYLNGEKKEVTSPEVFNGILNNEVFVEGSHASLNTIIKELILFKDDNKSWNEDLCKMISKYGFSDEMTYSGNAPHARIVSDDACKIEGTLPSSKVFEPIQYLRDRNDIVKGNIYLATVNGKVIKVVAKESKAWVAGSEIPDASLVPYTIKSMKGGF